MSQVYHCALSLLRAAVVCLSVCMGACAQLQHKTNQLVEYQLRANRAEEALKTLESRNYSGKTAALYLLNKAMVLRQMERYQESIDTFEKVKDEIGRLDAVSISESLMAYTISEQFSSYVPTTYEHIFVHIFQIMNFLALNQLDSARVEAMQIDATLNLLSDAGHYKEAAYARYITGLVFEANHEFDDAYISYQSAAQNYQHAPSIIPKDLQKRLEYLDPMAEQEDSPISGVRDGDRDGDVSIASVRPEPTQGQLLIFSDIDFAPVKTFTNTTLTDPESGHIFNVSLPHYVPRDLSGIRVQFTLNQSTFEGQMFADIESMAMDDLNREMPKLKRRALARNISKYALAEEASEEHEMLGQMVNIFGAFLELADNRSWLTLPNKIQVASQTLDQGNYSLSIDVLDQSNRTLAQKNIDNIEITANQFTFITFTWQDMPKHSIH